jgi:type II secretory pathway component PulC
MTVRPKVLVIFLMLFVQAGLAPFAPGQDSTDYQSLTANDKGIEILGAVLHNSPNQNSNVVLVKVLASNKTFAKQVGSVLILDQAYTITAVADNFMELQGTGRKMRLFKYGFTPAVEVKKVVEKKPVGIFGSVKEPGFEREDSNIRITEEYRKHMLEKDLPKILMQAAAEPKMDANGNILGFALFDIEKDSIYAKAGLVDGDLIKSINGEELNSAQGTIKLLNSLKNASGVNFTIERDGQSIPLNLDVR